MNADKGGLREESTANLPTLDGPVPAGQIVALTSDDALQQSLAELALAGHSLLVVDSVHGLGEVLVHAGTAVALVDTASVDSPIKEFVRGVTSQFPDLVLIVAGNGADQAALAPEVAASKVYRFLHKPASTQRLQIFLESALRHREDLVPARPATPPPTARRAPLRRKPQGPAMYAIYGAAGLLLLGVLAWLILRSDSEPDAKPPQAAAAATQAADAAALAARRAAEERQRQIDEQLASAETALTEGRIDEAAALVEGVRAISPDSSRLRFLTAQLEREKERQQVEERSRSQSGARQQRLQALLTTTRRRIDSGALLDPARDSARSNFDAAVALAPDAPEVGQARGELVKALLASADRSLDARNVDAARRMLDSAGSLGPESAELGRLRRRADELRAEQQLEAERARTASTPPASTVTPSAPPAAGVPATATPPQPPQPGTGTPVVAANALRRTRYVEVRMPDDARRDGVNGWVELEFTVSRDGSVRDVVVLGAEPRGYYEAASTDAVRRWRYAPVLRDGQPIDQRARLRLRFTIE